MFNELIDVALNAKTIVSLVWKKEQNTLFIFSLSRSLIIILIVEESPDKPINERFRKTVFMKNGLNVTKFLLEISVCGTNMKSTVDENINQIYLQLLGIRLAKSAYRPVNVDLRYKLVEKLSWFLI